MLTKPDRRVLRALYSFSNHAGWDDINKFLEAELAALYEQLTMALPEVTIRQAQGKAQFILDLQKLVREAPATLEKMRESTL